MARQTADEAIQYLNKTGAVFCAAETYRLKGLALLSSDSVMGQQIIEKSIEIARQQQAKTPELRATVDICRLWSQQGKTKAAVSRLSPIYRWFNEGFETKDLQEAQILLAELQKKRM